MRGRKTAGPEFVPPATGSASVVYWVPGPLPGPTPLSKSLRHGAAAAGRLTALAGWPGAGLASNIPSIAVMSTSRPGPSAGADQRREGLFAVVRRRYD